jgi:hypothetical protein
VLHSQAAGVRGDIPGQAVIGQKSKLSLKTEFRQRAFSSCLPQGE